MENLYDQIANVGFPIAVSTYLLVRIEGKLSLLTESINELTKSIIDLR
ncbi:YvrJ protein family protein [Dethiosulfatibacter aminovorans DSM 17477]|uniref:YvrJ protein family protein n=1 Tax=Dethiosulfatibacter aminovorans DSM 17477 TaxID=1121476 RepID=A0A1M6AWN7_9FIRM|nr:YvrJ family protein [Dethiosulfatibacter aminovorans]SHI40821.1 YvrJ protein family protein [Dethiosulfatibacter aminovorans DSM 17477]